MRLHLIILAFLLFILAGCTALPKGPDQRVDLPVQLARLERLEHWSLSGKMAVRNGKEAVSASLNWKTDGSDFGFRLTNMLGITLADLDVNQDGAVLEADGERYEDTDPNRLIASVTGLDIPLSRLLSWIKGLPRQDDQYVLNEAGLVSTLSPRCADCDGWQVDYDNYGNAGSDIWLPHTITLRQTTAQAMLIKIRIYEWTLP
ncbi:lipoprotein insertase outer membrane protein LolB [Alteromonas sp. CYL-A6]|uniref:lipoprotein insertase outer membrane protein LolB n=1 Tax=Alteromonas nitratireducens TaxID=3390813 RepID=UPI0034BBF465